MHTIYTAGYAHWTPQQLQDMLMMRQARLIDIRYTPRSRVPHWDRNALRAQFGTVYLHVPALGNVNYANGGPIKIAAPQRGIELLAPILAQQSVLLLCQCPDARCCHRTNAAELLAAALGAPVVHLEPPVDVPVGAIPALTVRQPWAWALFHGKDPENRSWSMSYRGPIAIHAGKTMRRYEYDAAAAFCAELGLIVPSRDYLTFGAVLGTANLVDVVAASDSDWYTGACGWVLRDHQLFPTPIAATGAQKLWPWFPPEDMQHLLRKGG